MIKYYLYKFGLWLINYSGYPVPKQVIHVPFLMEPKFNVLESTREFVAHIEQTSPKERHEFKRGQVLRALINRFPNEKIRDLNYAIEYVIKQDHV